MTACSFPNPAAAEQVDEVTIGVWETESERSEWARAHPTSDTIAAVGKNWVVLCEFRASCAQIHLGIGGLTY